MRFSILVASIALALSTFAAPAPQVGRRPRPPFASFPPRQANGSCDIAKLKQPPNTMTPPTADVSLLLIALGRGTQNYTCATPDSEPSAIGAVAELYNATCSESGPTTDNSIIGNHYFVDNTTPGFDIPSVGFTLVKKTDNMTAPDSQNVPWLLLENQEEGSSSPVRMIYRLNTVGGLAPKTCEGVAEGETVTVEYEAQYWIYACKETANNATSGKRAVAC